jgi:signal transduction histidine kinase/ActR/RegA family two-component response regulator
MERRVLLLPPTQRDSEAIRAVLQGDAIDCWVQRSMPEVCGALREGAAVLVVSEEALVADSRELLSLLRTQPVWADLPIVVLSRWGTESPRLTELLQQLGNVAVVERPVRISTFLSIVRTAMRGRARQYEVREHLRTLRAAEAERTLLWQSERTARAEAERAGRMKDEFLTTLSHEIRTPLNAILGWTHVLLKSAPGADELHKGLGVIERNARAQSQIVADLLDMHRIINGKVRLDVQRIALAPVIQAAVDTITPAADAKGIRIQVQVDDPEAGPVSGDPERLLQIFWNLLSNAVKFTPASGHIQVRLARTEQALEISVSDSGEGIDGEFLPFVFDRFRQADGSTTRRYGGLGLGLAIVKQLVELHGGRVRAESLGAGKGSTFAVVLPLTAAHEEQPAAAPRQPAGAARAGGPENVDDIAGVRVLVVDDEPDSRDIVKLLLEDREAQVATAASAREGLDLIQEWRPDVLISDIGMPEQDGYALIRQVRSLAAERGGRTVAIALTAYARAEDRVKAMRAGFQYHMSKPVDPTEFVAVVASAARLMNADE